MNVEVTAMAVDGCDNAPECRIVSIESNEGADARGAGRTGPDWEITGDLSAMLRAERSGSGRGRVYTILVACSDDSGNTAVESVSVLVPHDRGTGRR